MGGPTLSLTPSQKRRLQSIKHLPGLFNVLHKFASCNDFVLTFRNYERRFKFCKAPNGISDMKEELPSVVTRTALGDVRRNRKRRSLHLRHQAKSLIARQLGGQAVDTGDDVQPSLPDD